MFNERKKHVFAFLKVKLLFFNNLTFSLHSTLRYFQNLYEEESFKLHKNLLFCALNQIIVALIPKISKGNNMPVLYFDIKVILKA